MLLLPQGTKLKVFPNEIAAYDQDVGINANIFYTFNSGWFWITIFFLFSVFLFSIFQTIGHVSNIFTAIADTQDSRYFELDRVSGSVTVKRAIPEDDLLQPVTMVIRVSTPATVNIHK